MINNLKIYKVVQNPTLKKIAVTAVLTTLVVTASRYSTNPVPTIRYNHEKTTELSYYARVENNTYNTAIIIPFKDIYYIEIDNQIYIGYDDEIKYDQTSKLGNEQTKFDQAIEKIMKSIENEYRNGIFDLQTQELLIRKSELISYKWCHLEEKIDKEKINQLDSRILVYPEIMSVLEEEKTLMKE